MDSKTRKPTLLMLAALILAACNDGEQNTNKPTADVSADEEVGVIQPLIEEPILPPADYGEYKIGLYSEVDGQGQFIDCNTGKLYSVNPLDDTDQLHRTYNALRHADDEKMLVEIMGEIVSRKDKPQTLELHLFMGVIQKSQCL